MTMTLTCEESEGRRRVCLAGESAFETAGELRAILLDSLHSETPSAVDFAAASELDLGLVQVVLSARRTFAARGVPFTVLDSPGGPWERWLAAVGIGGDSDE